MGRAVLALALLAILPLSLACVSAQPLEERVADLENYVLLLGDQVSDLTLDVLDLKLDISSLNYSVQRLEGLEGRVSFLEAEVIGLRVQVNRAYDLLELARYRSLFLLGILVILAFYAWDTRQRMKRLENRLRELEEARLGGRAS